MGMIDLEKKAEVVRICLEKRNIRQVPPTRVGLALDLSGSAQHLYTSGIIQETVTRLQALAMRFDDNKELDVWGFSNSFWRFDTVTPANYETYVKDAIMRNAKAGFWHGTDYAPVMKDMVDTYFRGETKTSGGGLFGMFGKRATTTAAAPNANLPALGLFVTDGSNSDRAATARVLAEAKAYPMYWQLVGVGPAHEFGFLQEQADLLPNAGFLNLSRLDISDEALYDQLISDELCQWIAKR